MKSDELSSAARRSFIARLGVAATGAAAAAVAVSGNARGAAEKKAAAEAASFPTQDYDWSAHRWGYGVDATKCIG